MKPMTGKRTKEVYVFDAVGTLIGPSPPVIETYLSAGQTHGSKKSKPEIAGAFEQFRATIFSPARRLDSPTTSESIEKAKWRRLVDFVFDDLDDTDALFAALWDHFADPAKWFVFPDVAACWQRIRERSHAIVIASNFDQRLLGIVRSLSPLDSADAVFTSSKVGYSKPERPFYEIVERRVCDMFSGDELKFTMVGDDRLCDFEGPRACRWNSVWLDRSEVVGKEKANGVCFSLNELPIG